jgi:hypothetical protein
LKVPITCMKCLSEHGSPSYSFSTMEIGDDDKYELVCDKGHTTVTFLQTEKFEILFDMGAMAFLDGYNREAVSSLAASLERFYEWCVKVFLVHNNLDFKEIEDTWKLVASQSERQLGAFYFLYLVEFKSAPERIPNRYIEFRNSVIHKGYIPKRQEVIEYGEFLLSYMFGILKVLKGSYQDSIMKIVFERSRRVHELYQGKIQISTMASQSILNLVSGEKDYGTKTFEQSLEDLRTRVGLFSTI